jgi:hypothetical protein
LDVTDPLPRWPVLVAGLVAATSGGICLALGIDVNWVIIGNTAFGGLLVAWVLLRQPAPPEPEPPEIDEEFVRRLEALAARMRKELEARRAATPS